MVGERRTTLGLIAAWIALASAVMFFSPASGFSQTESEEPEEIIIQVKRIAVVPFFKGKYGSDLTETLRCPLCDLTMDLRSLSLGAPRILTSYVHGELERRYGAKVPRIGDTLRAYDQIPKDEGKDTLLDIARKLGRRLEANLVVLGTVWRYRDRFRSDTGRTGPAAVSFAVYLVDVAEGRLRWHESFSQTQQSLFENLLSAKSFFDKGAKWLTADELAFYGVKEVFRRYDRIVQEK
jgi:hypothetical protein